MIALLTLVLLAPEGAAAEAETKALQALAAGNVGEALDRLEEAIRAAEATPEKARLRDLYRRAGWAEPRPLNQPEELAVAGHVHAEKMRVFGQAADRFENRDRLQAAILLRKAMIEMSGGPGSEGAKPHENRIAGMIRRLTEGPSDEDKDLVAKLVRGKKSGDSLLKAGRKLLEQRQYRAVVRLCQEMMYGEYDQEAQNGALALRQEAEEKAAADVSAEDKKDVLDVLNDERFERLDIRLGRHFIYLGPKEFVGGLPEDQRTMLDLAYIFQSDLSGMHLTANQVRVVIYYQETFEFGGGLAGGKLIRIGDRAIRMPIAGMLHYHELGHCIFGKGWLHHGFTEGLADFAAGFTLDPLGQTNDAQRFLTDAVSQF